MRVHQLYTGNAYRNFSYLIEFNGKAFCVDPYYPQQILDELKELHLELIAIINTHEHFDHIAGNEELIQKTNCELWAHEHAKDKIQGVTRFLQKDEIIQLDEESYLKVMDTPGHTFAHLCLKIIEREEVVGVITGDTLFNAGVGNCHSGGDPEALYETIFQEFVTLPDTVVIYPGHEYVENNCRFTLSIEKGNKDAQRVLEENETLQRQGKFFQSTMKVERKINLFLKAKSKEEFLKLRKLRDHW